MALHLFPVPVQCQECGTVVKDPAADHCPNCGALLTERRTPSRLAGVERKYENFRLLLGFVRFLGVITGLVGILVFFFAEGTFDLAGRALTMLGALILGTAFFLVAAMIEVIVDLEENSRATFRVLQSIVERLPANPPPPR